MSTARLAQTFKQQVERKHRFFDKNSDINVTGFKNLHLEDADILEITRGLSYLSHQPKLEVDLSNTGLSDDGIKAVAKWLKSSNTPGKVCLRLNDLSISDYAASKLARAINSSSLPANFEIHLDGCKMSDLARNSLDFAIAQNQALQIHRELDTDRQAQSLTFRR